MTDQRMPPLALAVIIPLSLLLLSNSRIGDAKETLRAEIGTLRVDIQKNHTDVVSSLERIALQVKALEVSLETRIRIHELEHHR